MEDFSSILWVVIIVAAMIFNSVSKARKSRNNDGQPSRSTARPGPRSRGMTRRTPRKNRQPRPRKRHTQRYRFRNRFRFRPPISHNKRIPVPKRPRQWAESPFERGEIPEKRGGVGVSDAPTGRLWQRQRDSVRTVSPEPPVFTEFPDECQSLEVIPTEEGQSRTKRGRIGRLGRIPQGAG